MYWACDRFCLCLCFTVFCPSSFFDCCCVLHNLWPPSEEENKKFQSSLSLLSQFVPGLHLLWTVYLATWLHETTDLSFLCIKIFHQQTWYHRYVMKSRSDGHKSNLRAGAMDTCPIVFLNSGCEDWLLDGHTSWSDFKSWRDGHTSNSLFVSHIFIILSKDILNTYEVSLNA